MTNFFSLRGASGLGRCVGSVALLLATAGTAQAQLFGPAATYSTGGSTPNFAATGDLNGDGRPDIVAANNSSNSSTLSVLLRQASGSYGPAVTYPTGGSTPNEVALGDVNGDGKLDAVIVNFGSSNVAVLLGTGTGTFGTATTYALPAGGNPFGLRLADLDKDGMLDIVASNTYFNSGNGTTSGSISVLLNSAGGSFGPATTYATGGSPRCMVLADFNKDGALDIAATSANTASNSAGSGLLYVLLKQGSGFAPAVTYSTGSTTYLLATGDINKDGQPDLLFNRATGGGIGVMTGKPGGTFNAQTTYTVGGSFPTGVDLGDINGDGQLDVIVGDYFASAIQVMLGTSTGTFGAATAFSTGGNPYDVSLVDMNGDGKLDVVAANTGSGSVGVLLSPAVYPDLVVSTTTTIAAGTYNSLTVTGSGSGTLAGNVTVNSAVTVNSGGVLNDGCFVLSGAGDVTIAPGATLGICHAQGLSVSPGTGAIQTTGVHSYSTDATYVYNGTGAQVTGNALPTQVRSLGTSNANAVTLTSPVSVSQVVTVGSSGNLVSNGALTLRSSASGTALVVNAGTGIVQGTATVQRYLDGSKNAGAGYRHLSTPVSGSTVATLGNSSYAPVVNPAYNTSATPGTVTPFPTVYAYDQSRLATVSNNLSAFDKGWMSPTALNNALTTALGYAVNIGGGQLVSFTGTLFTGDGGGLAFRNAAGTPNAADAGWQLVGNPYPAPIDFGRLTPADRSGFDAACYVAESTGPYAGGYRAFVNGLPVGGGLIGSSQGFFMRVADGQATGSLSFHNSHRLTTYASQVPVYRTTLDLRPLVQLELRTASNQADALYAYAEAGATDAFDSQYDAVKLPNSTGLNLSSTASTQERLAIDGRAAFTAASVLPLNVGVPAAGTYTLNVVQLNNLPAGLDAYLNDAQTGQTTKLTAGSAYSFTVTAAQSLALITGRFTLQFRANTALATAAGLTPAAVSVYPSPAHGSFAVQVPAVAGASAVQADLLNSLGQVVRRQRVALPAAGVIFTVPANDLAPGVYTLRLQAGATALTKRIVLN